MDSQTFLVAGTILVGFGTLGVIGFIYATRSPAPQRDETPTRQPVPPPAPPQAPTTPTQAVYSAPPAPPVQTYHPTPTPSAPAVTPDQTVTLTSAPLPTRAFAVTSQALAELTLAAYNPGGIRPGLIIDHVRRVPNRGECLLDDQEYHLMSTLLDVLDRTGAPYTLMPKAAAAALAPNTTGVVDLLIVTDKVVPVLGFVITEDGRLPSWTDALEDYGIRMQAVREGHALEDQQVHAIMRDSGLKLPKPLT